MNVEKELYALAKSGKVAYGLEETLKLAKLGKTKLVVVSNSCPALSQLKSCAVPLYEFPGDSNELATACKKTFPISTLAVLSAGDSKILNVIK